MLYIKVDEVWTGLLMVNTGYIRAENSWKEIYEHQIKMQTEPGHCMPCITAAINPASLRCWTQEGFYVGVLHVGPECPHSCHCFFMNGKFNIGKRLGKANSGSNRRATVIRTPGMDMVSIRRTTELFQLKKITGSQSVVKSSL